MSILMRTNKNRYLLILLLIFCFSVALVLLAKGEKTMSKEKDNQTSACGLPMSEEELKKVLTPEQYRIMRENGTELPFKNQYWNNKKPGIYVDAISGEPLFSSSDKFESGTGWPSFIKPIEKEGVIEKQDTSSGMTRTEVRSKSSDSHLGHVFEDGPKPTGLRYCINSASLRFIPLEDMEKEGFGKYLSLFNKDAVSKPKTELATFGAGCFWGVEAAFSQSKGVVNTIVGFSGGTLKNPTYKDVCTNKTGHAEVVQVEYDPTQISYEKLLDVFWSIHNPTTKDMQGPDVGSQYRSVIFYHDAKQEEIAEASKEKLEKSGKFSSPIVTQIASAGEFYKAEDYHQHYYEKQGIKPTCHIPNTK